MNGDELESLVFSVVLMTAISVVASFVWKRYDDRKRGEPTDYWTPKLLGLFVLAWAVFTRSSA